MDFGVISSIVSGACTGIIGPVVTGITNYKMMKQKNQHEEIMIELESKAMLAEAEANIKIAKTKVEGDIAIAEAGAFTESMEIGNRDLFKESFMTPLTGSGMFGKIIAACIAAGLAFCDILKGLIRPVLTVYLVGASTWITILAYDIVMRVGMEAITAEWAQELFKSVVLTLIYLTVSCVGWWFADRRVGKFLDKQMNK